MIEHFLLLTPLLHLNRCCVSEFSRSTGSFSLFGVLILPSVLGGFCAVFWSFQGAARETRAHVILVELNYLEVRPSDWRELCDNCPDRQRPRTSTSFSFRHIANVSGLPFLLGPDQQRPKTSRPFSFRLSQTWFLRSVWQEERRNTGL